jgi:Flp pilus assembly protein TadD
MFERAIAAYRQTLALAPNFAAGYNNLAAAQKAVGDFAAAERSLAAALRLDPAYADGHYNLGLLRYDRRDLSGARESYLRSLELRPDNAAVHYNLGIVLVAEGDWNSARRHFTEALRLRPQYAQPHCHLGLMLLAHGEDDAALAHFDAALAIDPQCPEAHANRGAILLTRGDYQSGWPELAWSRRCASYAGPKLDVPAWDGAPLDGRSILVHGYHGLGDTLQFVRFLPELRSRGAGRVVLCVPEALHPLFRQSGLGELASPHEAPPRCDVSAAVFDLTWLLRPTERTIPAAPYLRVSPVHVAQWRRNLELAGFQVGIAWQGSVDYAWDHLRSIPLAVFAPLAAVHGVRLVSLQKGPGCEQLARLGGSFWVTDLGDAESRSLEDTAAIIANLDLVITCDTAIAHLAGATGAPVWTALSRGADWRWGRAVETTPWYPTMRLFRQQVLGRWGDVFESMAARLRELVAAKQARGTATP